MEKTNEIKKAQVDDATVVNGATVVDSAEPSKKLQKLEKSASRKNEKSMLEKNETAKSTEESPNVQPSPPQPPPAPQNEKPIWQRLRLSTIKQRAPQDIASPAIVSSTVKRRGRGRTQKTSNATNAAAPDLLNVTSIPVAGESNLEPINEQGSVELTPTSPPLSPISKLLREADRLIGDANVDYADEQQDETTNDDDNDDDKDAETSLNPELKIMMRWDKTQYEYFTLRKYQKFGDIMQQLAERENVPLEEIVLNLRFRIIEANDSPDSIGYKTNQYIDGRVMKFENIFTEEPMPTSYTRTTMNKCEVKAFHLKIQSDRLKHPICMTINKSDVFEILYIKCAEELKVEISKIRLYCDGEQIALNETPNSMGLDICDVIDLKVV